jgi:hypothetical protein
MEPHKLINWSEVSRLIAGSRDGIRHNRVGGKNKIKVERLIKLIRAWMSWAKSF